MEKIIVNPGMVRGSGNVIDPHAVEDYELYNSTIAEGSATIDGVETQVYNMEMMSSTITVALSASVSSVSIGGTVVLTATVLDEETPVTGENVTFKAGTSVLGTATTDSNGVATYNYVTDTVGFFSLTAVYSNVISTPVILTVNKITPTVVLTANSSTVCIDEGVTLTATVKNGNIGIPGITVNFKREGFFDAGSVTTDSNGVATLSRTFARGTHTLNCSTVATDNYNSANSSDVSVTVTLIPTTTSLSLSQSTIYVDGSSTASATLLVRSTPLSGEVIVFYDGTSIVGSALTNSNGVATYSLSGLTAGSHSITAYFNGGQNRQQSTSTAQTLTVLDHSYSLAFSQSSYVATGGSATLECTLLDNNVPVEGATISVSGSDGSLYTGLTDSSGVATVTVTGVSSETTFTASYSNVTDSCIVTVSSLIWEDNFTTATNNWLKQGNGGTLTRGNGTLSWNYSNGSGKHNCCYYNQRVTGNFKITATFSNGNYDTIVLGVDPSDNFKRLGIQPKWSYELYTNETPSNTTRLYATYNYPVTIVIERVGTTVKLYINDSLYTTFTWLVSSLDGYIGIDQCENRTTTCTSFKVEAL